VQGALEELASGGLASAPSGYISLEYNAISGANSLLPTNSGSVRLNALSDCYIKFGDSGVTADMYLAKGSEVFGLPAGATHIAVKGAGENGLLSVTGLDGVYKYTYTGETIVSSVLAGSSLLPLPSNSTKLRVFSMTDCFIKFGDSSVIADNTSMFFGAGTEIMRIPSGATHIAVKRYALNGGLYISGVN